MPSYKYVFIIVSKHDDNLATSFCDFSMIPLQKYNIIYVNLSKSINYELNYM